MVNIEVKVEEIRMNMVDENLSIAINYNDGRIEKKNTEVGAYLLQKVSLLYRVLNVVLNVEDD